ncbi:hypothetical protein ACWEQL_35580, partial [Kitasatospora sp. NPDC004240]
SSPPPRAPVGGAPGGGGGGGAPAPLPGVDPRAFGRGGSVLRPLMGRRAAQPAPVRPQPAAAAPMARPAPARGRRLVFAAAGAFSVAAVTLGGVGSFAAPAGDGQRGTSVRPAGGSGGGYVPMNAQVPVDFPVRPVSATRSAVTPAERPPADAPRPGLAALHREER